MSPAWARCRCRATGVLNCPLGFEPNAKRRGWTFGAGVEYAFAQHWSAFIEYNYIDLGTKDANSTHLLSLPNNVPASLVIPIQATATERFNVVKVGVNYRFNWLGL